MHYTAVVTKEGKQTLAKFPGCPGCQTFADPGEDIAERAEEALAGWLEAHLASGQAPLEPKKLRWKGRGRTMEVPVPAKLAVKLAVRWGSSRASKSSRSFSQHAIGAGNFFGSRLGRGLGHRSVAVNTFSCDPLDGIGR